MNYIVAMAFFVPIVTFVVWLNILDREEMRRRATLPADEQAALKLEDDIFMQTW